MLRHVSAREARARFAEVTSRVHYTGEPVVVEKQGQAFVALISLEDLEILQRLRADQRQDKFTRRAAEAALEISEPEPTEQEIVEMVKATREEIYRRRYGKPVGSGFLWMLTF